MTRSLRLPLPVVLAILDIGLVVIRGMARAMASDSDGGRKITPAEWAALAADAWEAIRRLDLGTEA